MKIDPLVQQWMDDFGSWFSSDARMADGKMTQNLYPYDSLFSPIQINSIKLKNRIVMGPMGNVFMAEETGRPNNKMVQYFLARAKGGTGLLTSGLIHVSQKWDPTITEANGSAYYPRINGSRTVFTPWRELAQQVHAYGTHFFIQLSAGMGRVGAPECLLQKKKLPISASWNPNYYISQIPCAPLRDGQIHAIARAFGEVARDVKSLGIDGVYLHAHEGYLMEQLANPAYNRRGGKYKDWQRFGMEVVEEIRKTTGPKYPIMYRIDLSQCMNEIYGDRMKTVNALKKFQNGRTMQMTLEYMANLVKARVDLFDVDLGGYENWWVPHPPNAMPPGCFLGVAKLAKDYFQQHQILSNQKLPVPIVAVGKLGYPDLAERALRENQCDMIMLARPLLADPEWPNKVYAGKVAEYRPCIGDQEACLNELVESSHLQCSVNPRTAFEDTIPEILPPAPIKKKVGIVGAGPAGVLCAITAASRGHQVTIFDKQNKAGGVLLPGGVAKIKYEIQNYVDYLNNQLQKDSAKYNITVKFNTTVTPDQLKNGGFDTLIIATGSVPNSIPVEGVNASHVIQAIDLFNNPSLAAAAKNVVVVGGGVVGCEAAYYLAFELKKQVSVVEMLPALMKGSCTANRGFLIHYLEKGGVKLLNCTTVKSISKDQIVLKQNIHPSVPDPLITWNPLIADNIVNPFAKPIQLKETEVSLPCELVVLAVGVHSNDSLYEEAVKKHLAPEIHRIGDAFHFGRIWEATKAGFTLGRTI